MQENIENRKIQNSGISGGYLPVPASVDKSSDAYKSADASYEILKNAIGLRMEAAIAGGKLLLQQKPTPAVRNGRNTIEYGPINFDDWRGRLPLSVQQHYNCNHCRAIWTTLAGLAIIHDDGSLEFPAMEAVRELASEDPVCAQLFNHMPDMAHYYPSLMPLGTITEILVDKEVGGWSHFYGARDRGVIRQYLKDHIYFSDFKYTQDLYQQLSSSRLNLDVLRKLATYVKTHLGKQVEGTALTRSDQLIELMTNVRAAQKNYRRGLVYLMAALQVKANGWMRHINGSVLGIVLDAAIELQDSPDSMDLVLSRCKNLLKSATAADNYKQTTAPATEQHLRATYEFLTEKGWQGALSRKLLPLSEAASVVWDATNGAMRVMSQQEVQPEGSELDKAFNKLVEKKDPNTAVNNHLDKVLDDMQAHRNISLKGFIEKLPEFTSMSLSGRNQRAFVLLGTAGAEDGDFTELMAYDGLLHPTGAMIMLTHPVDYREFTRMALRGMVKDPELMARRDASALLGSELKVDAVVEYGSDGDKGYLLQVHGFAPAFYDYIKENGSCVLNTMIRNEHAPLQRTIRELSQQMKMHNAEDTRAVGGIKISIGNIIDAVDSSGVMKSYVIVSDV